MNKLFKLAGVTLLLGYPNQNAVFASTTPQQLESRRRFSDQENAKLIWLVELYGSGNWNVIADYFNKYFPARPAVQLRAH
ncbi:MAG: SANT/Myb domain-containing protein [Holosporales bacterium]|nr:SANT/Myb domain-containing protein [Holosporales bacterium]